MKYNIGDVARTLGLTPGALHYFEDEGIIRPNKEPNGHRSYTDHDLYRLVSYRKYRAMGIPVKDIVTQFAQYGDPLQTFAERLEEKRQEAAAEEKRLRSMQRGIQWFQEALERIPVCLDRYDVVSSPGMFLLKTGQRGLVPKEHKVQNVTQKWLKQMPQTRLSVTLGEDGKAHFCYGLSEEEAEDIVPDEHITYVAPQLSIHTVVSMPDAFCVNPSLAFEPVLAFLKAHQFKQNGRAFGHSLVVDCSGEFKNIFAEIWMPFTAFE